MVYASRKVLQDPGVRYLGPWAQYTFPQKEYSLDQQATDLGATRLKAKTCEQRRLLRGSEHFFPIAGASPSAKRAPTVRRSRWPRHSGLVSTAVRLAVEMIGRSPRYLHTAVLPGDPRYARNGSLCYTFGDN